MNRLLKLFEIFLTISKNCQPNVLSTRVSKTECYKHTFSENFGLCFKFVLISILFFTKLSGVQSTNDGGLLGRAIVAFDDHLERSLTEMSERDATEVPVQPSKVEF